MHNHVTVIPADNTILVNGEGLNFDFIAPENMHALQWHDGGGHIEYTDGQANRPLTAADYDVEVAPFTALWQAEYDRLEAEKNRPLTPEELHAIAEQRIKSRLLEIDLESVRPLRAKVSGTSTPEDDATLAALEQEAEELREELAGVGG